MISSLKNVLRLITSFLLARRKFLLVGSVASFLFTTVVLNAAPVVYIDDENDIFMAWEVDSFSTITGSAQSATGGTNADGTNQTAGVANATLSSSSVLALNGTGSSIVGGAEGGGKQTLANLASYENDASQSIDDPVGHLAGDFSVGGMGESSYNIPIALPPGTAGVRPEVSLSYSSQQGMGLAGKGWNLTGLSAVSRCGRSMIHDNKITGVKLNEEDAFCLDGQRLIPVTTGLSTNQIPKSGNGVVRYRTEMDNHSVINGHFSGHQPVWFSVESKDGMTRYYGTSNPALGTDAYHSRVVAFNWKNQLIKGLAGNSRVAPVMKWALSQMRDKKSNYINYEYEKKRRNGSGQFVGLEHRLKRIAYTGNISTGLSPYAYVDFNYGTEAQQQSDVKFGTQYYVAGAKFSQSSKLRAISVKLKEGASSTATEIRQYVLSYDSLREDSLHRYARLTSIQECVNGGNSCQPATHFVWDGSHQGNNEFKGAANTDSNGYDANEFDLVGLDMGKPTFRGAAVDHADFGWGSDLSTKANRLVGDINGDGISDVVYIRPTKTSNGGIYTIKAVTSTGKVFTSDEFSTSNLYPNFLSQTRAPDRRPRNVDELSYHLADVNGDGKSDLVGFGNKGIDVLISDGTKFNRKAMVVSGHSPHLYKSKHPRLLQDVTGDGRADIVLVVGHGVVVWPSTGETFGSSRTWIKDFGIGNANYDSFSNENWDYQSGYKNSFNLADVNGDGLPDAVGFGRKGVLVALNTGSRFELQAGNEYWNTIINSNYFHDDMPRTLADVNGDGLTDLVVFSHQGVKVAYSTGSTFVPFGVYGVYSKFGKNQGWSSMSERPRHMIDVNGDGKADIVGFTGGKATHVSLSNGHRFYEVNGNDSWGDGFGRDAGWKSSNNMRSFGDFNGDGLVDIIGINKQGIRIGDSNLETLRIKHIVSGGVRPPNSSITTFDGMHRSIEINYVRLTHRGAHYSPGTDGRRVPMYVVARHYSSNGDIGSGSSNNRATMAYVYSGLKFDSGAKSRGVLGFASRKAVDEVTGQYTTNHYRQDFPHVGSVRLSVTRAKNNKKLSSTENIFKHEIVSSGDAKGSYKIWQEKATEQSFEYPSEQIVKRSETINGKPDYCGNITQVTSKVSNSSRSEEFTKVTKSTYPGSGSCYQRGRLITASVDHQVKGKSGLNKKRNSSFTYYANGQIESETIEPGSAFALTTNYTYDSYGNVLTKEVKGKDFSPRKTVTTYEAKGRFAKTVANGLGHKSETSYNERFGTVTKTIDPNGLISRAAYNDFGQKYLDAPVAGNVVLTKYEWCHLNLPNSAGKTGGVARYCVIKKDQNIGKGQYVKTYFDQVDRAIRVEKMGMGDDGSHKIVYVDKIYDSNTGRLLEETRPYYRHGNKPWVKYQYDEIGRTKKIIQPDGGVGSVEYAGLTTHKTNALNQKTSVTISPNGKTKKITDAHKNTTEFNYDGLGNILNTVVTSATATRGANKKSVTSFTYDASGNKESMNDPDMGKWSYTYNALGELLTQKDAKGQTTSMTYDAIGRMLTRTDGEGVSRWVYDGVAGKGRVAYTVSEQFGKLRHRKEFLYTPRGQVGKVIETLPDNIEVGRSTVNYVTSTEFDKYGRPIIVRYPRLHATAQPVVLRYDYNTLGVMYRVRNESNLTEVHWQVNKTTASGKVIEHVLNGNKQGSTGVSGGINVETGYDVMEMTNKIRSSSGAGTLQSLSYQFDKVGNLKYRKDALGGMHESFGYDALNRLTSTTTKYRVSNLNGATATGTKSNKYDGHGNLLFKDARYHNYDATKTHALRYVKNTAGTTLRTYNYDANGNMVSGDGRTIEWTSFNKPSKITKDKTVVSFGYGINRERLIKEVKDGTKTWYIGGLVERELKKDGSELLKYHLKVGGNAFGTIKQNFNAAKSRTALTLRYVLKDHLGSVDTIVDSNNKKVAKLSFSSWGERRGDTWSPLNTIQYNSMLAGINKESVKRGFTGHEHDDEVGLINMGGRLYDAKIGRFISADPHVQAPSDTQSYNRYSYVKNNPLSYTDPSGYFFKKLFKKIGKFFKKWGRTILAIGAAALTAGWSLGWQAAASFGAAVKAGALAGAVSGAISTGTLKGALTGALFGGLSAGAAYGIGHMSGITSLGGKAVAHGVAQGGINVLQGGKFKSGFMGGFFGHVSGGLAQGLVKGSSWGAIMGRTAISSIVGGTISQISGGKFANGAITAAFTHLFNQEAGERMARADQRCKMGMCHGNSGREHFKEMTDSQHAALVGALVDSTGAALLVPTCVTTGSTCVGASILAGQAGRNFVKASGANDPLVAASMRYLGSSAKTAQGHAMVYDSILFFTGAASFYKGALQGSMESVTLGTLLTTTWDGGNTVYGTSNFKGDYQQWSSSGGN